MDTLSSTFAALADPTRRAILARLAQGETHVGELLRPLPMSGPAVSRHLRVLEHAGLIERSVDAQWRVCRLRPDALQPAHDWLDAYRRFWEASLDSLAELLEGEAAPPPPASAPRAARAPRSPQPKQPQPTPSTTPSARKPRP
jgi:DNA-binding transcriptional ArsR family regulator